MSKRNYRLQYERTSQGVYTCNEVYRTLLGKLNNRKKTYYSSNYVFIRKSGYVWTVYKVGNTVEVTVCKKQQ